MAISYELRRNGCPLSECRKTYLTDLLLEIINDKKASEFLSECAYHLFAYLQCIRADRHGNF